MKLMQILPPIVVCDKAPTTGGAVTHVDVDSNCPFCGKPLGLHTALLPQPEKK